MKAKIVIIYGQTASGKSDLAIKIAKRFSGEIISADSVQVYDGFDIGSAKIPQDKTEVPHYLISIRRADQEYSAADFDRDARRIISELIKKKRLPVITGGTNFYIKALLNGMENGIKIPSWINQFVKTAYRGKREKLYQLVKLTDPKRAYELSSNDLYRLEKALSTYLAYGKSIKTFKHTKVPSFDPIKIGIICDKKRLKENITKRVYKMFSSGIIEETRNIIKNYGTAIKPLYSIGYRQALGVINGALSVDEAIKQTIKESMKYAKRQATWLRKESGIRFFDANDNALFGYIESRLNI